jgi:two-component system chemotaxis response regulator CheB
MTRPLSSRFGARPGDDTARVLIVDDSVVARAVMGRMIDACDRYSVAGAVANAKAALEFLARAEVDFILLDIEMPGIDGLTALPDLIAAGHGAKVLIVSSSADEGGAATIQALALGAAETLVKPGSSSALSGRFGTALLEKLDRLSDSTASPPVASIRPLAQAVGSPVASVPAMPRTSSDDYDIVAIGASTGGIHALSQLLRALPLAFRLPIVITQHLPASFMPYFAAQLSVLAGRPCDVATDSLRIRAGRIVVAPGDAHLKCVKLGEGKAALRLVTEPAATGCMPSVDPMLSSMAQVYGARMLAIVLSGMGRDGADGARRVHDAGGCVIAQDQASSVVWGMPGAVASSGIADAVMTPDAIGRLVASRRRP